jgi:ribonuclease P protein component
VLDRRLPHREIRSITRGPGRSGSPVPSAVASTARSSREAHVPAQGPPPIPQARLPPPHVGSRRTGHHQGPAPQGPSASVGLIALDRTIDRISERDVFRRFRGSRDRARSGPLHVVRMDRIDSDRPAIAFAVSRRVGSAVVRNRVRRQLRHVARAAVDSGDLGVGWYLVIVAPDAADQSFVTLSDHFAHAIARLASQDRTGVHHV